MEKLIGKTFGKLKVTGTAEPVNGRGRVTYICECGATGVRRSDQVVNAISCGCVRRQKATEMSSARLIDLSGKRFGRLLVQSRAENERGRVIWSCLCDCGRLTGVIANNLTRGNTVSCGCARDSRETVRPADFRAKKNAIVKRRYRNDPKFAIEARVRAAVHKHLRATGETKKRRLYDALGYTADQLRDRLMQTMPHGYDWDDFLSGGLHIDHITPLSAFNFTTVDDLDFRRAWALSNLRLLPAAENIQKSDKLSQPFQPSLCF